MLDLIIGAALFGVTPETVQPATNPAWQEAKPDTDQTKAWTLPHLDYSGSGCEQFMQRQLSGFGNLKVGTPCPSRPAEAASKGRSLDKRN